MTVAEEQKTRRLIRQLKSPLRKYREGAKNALKHRLPEALPFLLEAEKREATKRRIAVPLMTGTLISYTILFLSCFTFLLSSNRDWFCLAFLIVMGLATAMHRIQRARCWASKSHLNLLSLLIESDDIRVLPTLLKNLTIRGNVTSNTVHGQILARSLHLLEKATPQDLPPDCLPGLHLLLKEKNVPLQRAALLALERVGNASSLPHILAVIRRVRPKPNSPKNQLLQFATHCREVIETRIAEQNVSGVLLRPSEVPPLPETLLRPVDSVFLEADPQELLRAGDSPEKTETQTISQKGN